jgi:hypothetical protein
MVVLVVGWGTAVDEVRPFAETPSGDLGLNRNSDSKLRPPQQPHNSVLFVSVSSVVLPTLYRTNPYGSRHLSVSQARERSWHPSTDRLDFETAVAASSMAYPFY